MARVRSFAVVAMVVALTSPARAGLVDKWDETFTGIRHLSRTGTDANGVEQRYHVALIDLDASGIDVRPALNRDTWLGAKEVTSAMATRNGAQLAINGDYWSGGSKDPSQGTTTVNGTCYRAHPERSALAWSRDR